MTARPTPLWHGAKPTTPIPERVKLRVLLKHEGRCALTGHKFVPGDVIEFDHIVALINGGENREDNIQPVLGSAHKEKTRQDVKAKAKSARVRAKHLGLKKPKRKMPYRRFNGEPVWPDRREG